MTATPDANEAAQKNLESFTRRAGNFTQKTGGQTLVPLREVLEGIAFPAGGWAADFGIGTGNSAIPFIEAGGRVIGVDITPAMALTGKKRLADEGLGHGAHFTIALCEQTPIPDAAVDCAICRNVFHHLANPDDVVCEMSRVVRPGGHVIVMDHCYPDSDVERARIEEIDHIREPEMVRILSPKDFRGIYAACGLEVTEVETMNRRDTFDNWISGAETGEATIREVREGVERLRDEGGESWLLPEGEGDDLSLLRWDAIVVGKKL
ncbi:MAG: class I SAM-dependent methyltransferase [Nitrospinaceae bacterium]|nr:class I SAM-dependent methyltransferase [Nitrospinaceae bacterium]